MKYIITKGKDVYFIRDDEGLALFVLEEEMEVFEIKRSGETVSNVDIKWKKAL